MTDNVNVLDYVPPDLIDEVAAVTRLAHSLEPLLAEVAHRAADVQRSLSECVAFDTTDEADEAVVHMLIVKSGSEELMQELDALGEKLQDRAGGDRSALHEEAA